MGKGYIFTGKTEIGVNAKIKTFRDILARKGFNRRVSISGVSYNAAMGKYRAIVDVCGSASVQIDTIVQTIENS
jgi:hypothetical protein